MDQMSHRSFYIISEFDIKNRFTRYVLVICDYVVSAL